MNVNISLVGQVITFGILIFVTMKYVWPPLVAAIDRRNKEIAEGLDAAEQGRQRLKEAKERQDELIEQGRAKQMEHVAEGRRQRDATVSAARDEAGAERERIVEEGRRQVEQERQAMVRELQESYADLVVAGASRILKREIDAKDHKDIVDDLIKTI